MDPAQALTISFDSASDGDLNSAFNTPAREQSKSEIELAQSAQRIKDAFAELLQVPQEARECLDIASKAIAKNHIPRDQLQQYLKDLITFATLSGTTNLHLHHFEVETRRFPTPELLTAGVACLAEWRSRFSISDDQLAALTPPKAGDVFPEPSFGRQRLNLYLAFTIHLSGQFSSPAYDPPTPEAFRKLVAAYGDLLTSADIAAAHSRSVPIGVIGQPPIDRTNLERSLERFAMLTHLIDEAKHCSQEAFSRLLNTSYHHSVSHRLPVDVVKTIVSRIGVAIESQSPEVMMLQAEGNRYSVQSGDFGAADFIIASYVTSATPSNISFLRAAARSVPATSLARLEQNRIDALRMGFGSLRDLIHDQRPYVHEIISAMVGYYDASKQSDVAVAAAQENLERVVRLSDPRYVNNDRMLPRLLDLTLYDTEMPDSNSERVSTISRLRRLAQNTSPRVESPPVSDNADWNKLVSAVGTHSFDRDALGKSLAAINEVLEAECAAAQPTLTPQRVLSLSYIDQSVYAVLEAVDFEAQRGLLTAQWFHEVLRFQELTASAQSFDRVAFDKFLTKLTSASSFESGYQMVFDRCLLTRLLPLAHEFRERGHPEWSDALWSGNIDHELIDLVLPRAASTKAGSRIQKELAQPLWIRSWGD